METTILVVHPLTIAAVIMTALEILNAVTLMAKNNAPILIIQEVMVENNLKQPILLIHRTTINFSNNDDNDYKLI